MSRTTVVSAVITLPRLSDQSLRDTPVRILMAQRPRNKGLPLFWETPGGKLEGDESHHDALRRELKEELGITLGQISEEAIWAGDVTLPDGKRIFLLFLRVFGFTGEITPTEGQGWGWFDINEFRALNVTPGNNLAKEYIMRAVWQ